ncbi:2-oxoacid:acceptor oxidoreductase subunit alpha [Candidatus Latescibacterota bacterium]
MTAFPAKRDDISIVLCGAAGQGIQTVEQLLTHVFKLSGYNLFSTKEYMSRVRGGSNSTEIRVSSHKVNALVDTIDLLFPLSSEALKHVSGRISPETIIIGEKETLEITGDSYEILDIPLTEIAKNIGGAIYSNIIIVGVIAALFKIDSEILKDYLNKRFASKGEAIVEKNTVAIETGFKIGAELVESSKIDITLSKDESVSDEIIVNGGDAVSMGAIAGGCNFVASYPMTPSTSVLMFLAGKSKEFDILVEQAEDEIAAINMAIGAWYAGARALVTTSGGGYALMAEGLSLAGIMESPAVIHLAQRPGPGTGQPTRTEQSDLLFALFSGHGEFPRIIFAPGTLEEGFHLTIKAFDLADKYQVPVFVMTDQYFIDSYYNIPKIEVSGMKIDHHVIETDADYRRYEITDNGVSPRGIPGKGDGLVIVDSDEHDYAGHLTENLDLRVEMNDKRLSKIDAITKEAVPPKLLGNETCKYLVVCWGSTYNIINESVRRLGRDDVSTLHFSQVYPLHPDSSLFFKNAENVIIVENNATSQFASVLKLYLGIDIPTKILKYNGLAFSVEEVAEKLADAIS